LEHSRLLEVLAGLVAGVGAGAGVGAAFGAGEPTVGDMGLGAGVCAIAKDAQRLITAAAASLAKGIVIETSRERWCAA
jgi:hypothetical protein